MNPEETTPEETTPEETTPETTTPEETTPEEATPETTLSDVNIKESEIGSYNEETGNQIIEIQEDQLQGTYNEETGNQVIEIQEDQLQGVYQEETGEQIIQLTQKQFDTLVANHQEKMQVLNTIADNTTPKDSIALSDNVFSLNTEQFDTLTSYATTEVANLTLLNTVIIPLICIVVFGWWFFSQFLHRYR